MTGQFHEGWEHNTIAGYRSVILAFHNPIDGCKVDNHRRLSALVTCIFNLKSPEPRYPFIWDVDQVLNYPNNLTVLLIILLALTTVSSASELTHLDIRYMINSSLFHCFTLTKPTLAMKPEDSHPKRIFKGFGDHKNLFVCKAFEDYLQKLLVSNMEKLIF